MLANKEITGDELARRVGVSPSMISSIDKLGIGGRSINGFAKVLGFDSADEMRKVAYAWWQKKSPETADRAEEPAVAEAIAIVRGLHPQVSDGAMRTILHRFSDPGFNDRGRDYWIRTLMEEIQQDYLRAQRQQAERQSRAAAEQRENGKIESAFREASSMKKKLESRGEAGQELPVESTRPDPRHSAAVPKRQRKHA